jgi:hypothetical protein
LSVFVVMQSQQLAGVWSNLVVTWELASGYVRIT